MTLGPDEDRPSTRAIPADDEDLLDVHPPGDADPSSKSGTWTFMTNHAHVLFCLAQDPSVRLREVATRVGITERAVQRIVHDLQEGHYISITKEGRRNRYQVNDSKPLRHEVERHRTVAELMQLIFGG